ncbi:MAG: phosphatase PAP2 family protein [Saprospiraceae bacterium]
MVSRRVLFLLLLFLASITTGLAQRMGKDSTVTPFTYKPKISSLILPISLVSLGAYSIHNTTFINRFGIKNWQTQHFKTFNTDADDFLQHASLAAGLVLAAFDKSDKKWLFLKRVVLTEVITNIAVQTIKRQSHILRPNNSDYLSFPSGHTTEAFAGAALFCDHYAKGKPWLQVLTYSAASTVGILRILKNRHWANDVIAGAGLGILSVKLSEFVFREKSTQDAVSIN